VIDQKGVTAEVASTKFDFSGTEYINLMNTFFKLEQKSSMCLNVSTHGSCYLR